MSSPRAPITPGTVIGERYCLVERYLGPKPEDLAESGGGRAFVAEIAPQRTERVVVHLYTPEVAPLYQEWREFFDRCMRCRHKTLAALLAHGVHDGLPYLVTELMHGHPLTEAIERKHREHSAFLPRTALSLLKPVARALQTVHEHSCHGVISPDNIWVQRGGSTRLAGLGQAAFGREVGRKILGHKHADARFSAPELQADPGAITKLSDIYSLGLVTVSMLTGGFPDPKQPAALADKFLTAVPETLALAVSDALSSDPAARPYSTESFIQRLGDGIEDLRAQIMELSGSPEAVVDGAPTETKPAEGFERRGSLSGLIAAAELPPTPQEDDPTVWLVHRGGIDYGPYSAEQVREQLLQDQIDEHTEVRNLDSGERGFLVELQEFTEFVADYIPQREERRRREAERRAEVQRKVKRASAAGVISAFVGVLAILGFYLYYAEFIRPRPEPVPFERVFARVRTDFAPPNLGYVGIAADPELIASLFDFSEEEEPVVRRSRPRSDGTAAPYDEGDPNDLGTIDFVSGSDGGRRLTVTEVARVVRGEGRAIQRCFTEERRSNDRYDRIERVTVRFTVRPNGAPVGVSLAPGRYSGELSTCLVRIFREFRYPEFDGLAMPFNFPIEVP